MLRLPGPQNRTIVIGSTGSGKTQFAGWLMSTRDFTGANGRPWFIFDFKGDGLIARIEQAGAKVLDTYIDDLPREAGIYIFRPIPQQDDKQVQDLLWKMWRQEYCGIYVDEGYMLGNRNPALNACLTQGRSKYIEMIILSQRPVWMSKFVFSEANFFSVFNLTLEDDRKFVSSYIGGKQIELLPRYHSLWYDVDEQEGVIFKPVPSADDIIDVFKQRLSKPNKTVDEEELEPERLFRITPI